MRVHEVIQISKVRAGLRGKIPKECLTLPDPILKSSAKYPMSLLKIFPKKHSYKILGVLSEYLLRYPSNDILSTLLQTLAKGLFNIDIPPNILSLKSTLDYMDRVKQTRLLLESKFTDTYQYETVLSSTQIEGHPDIRCGSNILEVKTSGRVKTNWNEFLMQVFAYAALDPTVTHVHLVLPLDAYVWSYDLTGWDVKKRNAYKKVLEDAHQHADPEITDELVQKAHDLLRKYRIGVHIEKQKTLFATLMMIVENLMFVPMQMFLTGPTSLSVKDIPDAELEKCKKLIRGFGLYIYFHAPYTINLADKDSLESFLPCLEKHLKIGATIGVKGVVVHVGKHCNRYPSVEVARNHMKIAIHEILKLIPADSKCRLLLETPAGQGTELLTKMEDFIEFALEMTYELTEEEQTKFGICLDTCHVFATGTCPKRYLDYTLEKAKHLLKLIHFNDSKGDCGSCVDRHEIVCCGKINPEILESIAVVGAQYRIDMLTE